MKATWEKLEKNEGLLRIEVDEQKVAQALDQAFKKVVQKINVPGFRKGKVPRGIFEARFGVESLYQDALDIILPEVYTEALNETGVEPIDRPEIDVEQFEKGSPLKFTAKVQVKPDVTLGEYKGLQVEEKSFEVSDEEVDGEIKAMQQRHAELIVLDESQAAESGDTVILDFEGFVDGEAFEGGKAEKYSLELGSNSFIPGFEEQLIGVVKDEDKDVNVTFPEEYHAENLKGKEAVFKVHIHEIKRKNLPELDDEFAKDVSEFETLAEYREDVKNNIAERKENERKQYIENTVIDQAVDAAEVEIPEVMITTEVDQMLQDFAGRLRMQGMDMELYFQYSGQDEAALREQMKGDAERRVRTNLVLQAIAQAEGVEASEEELQAEYERMAEMYKKTADEIREILDANGSVTEVKRDLANRKVIDLLVEQSQTKAVEA